MVAAPDGNAANAAKCADGGYIHWADAQGNPFWSEGKCTSYAAKGGTLTPAEVPTATLTFEPVAVPPLGTLCAARITVSGYAPGTYEGSFGTPESEFIFFDLVIGLS